MPGRIAVVGGANVDIGGFSKADIVPGDSNPGRVRISIGGVGRNIAEGCARLGLDVSMITAIGCDPNGALLKEDCRKKGIDISACLETAEENTSVYLFVDNADGDMYVAVNDMGIQTRLTPEFLKTRLDLLNSCDAVVIDANLLSESIRFLADNVHVPIFADTVSAIKAERLKPILPSIYALKPNRLEAEILTGLHVVDREDAQRAVRELTRSGVGRVFLTMGDKGVVCGDGEEMFFLPCSARKVVNATGAGDAFMAASIWACMQDYDLKTACLAGMAASTIAIESEETVSPEMNCSNLLARMKEIN